MNDLEDTIRLPLRQNLTFAFAGSLAISVLMTIGSAVVVLRPTMIYPTSDVLRSSLPADLVNLFGMPLLLTSMWLARRGRLVGLLLWPGALLFLLYHDLAFLFGMPFSGKYPLHVILAAMNLCATIILVANVGGTAVKQRLAGRVFEKTGGGVLIGLGVLFLLWAIAVMVNSLFRGIPITTSDFAVRVTDILMSSMDHRRSAALAARGPRIRWRSWIVISGIDAIHGTTRPLRSAAILLLRTVSCY